jgi:hypothetical protein
MRPNPYSWLFRLACRVLKYFLLFLLGFVLVCFLSWVLITPAAATRLLSMFGMTLLRSAVVVVLLMAAAIVDESLRN